VVGVARATIAKAQLSFADEPTGAGLFMGDQGQLAAQCLNRLAPGFLNSLRLDGARNAFLLQQEERGRHVLSVIQYDQPDAKCPVILDPLVATEKSSTFEYDCSVAPSAASGS
jgi:hypothetical protein